MEPFKQVLNKIDIMKA